MSGPSIKDTLFSELAALLNDRFSVSAAEREHHAADESYHAPMAPDAVAYPVTVDEVAQIVRRCNETKTPVIPFGAGSGVEGGVLAVRGGVSLDLSRMNRILRVGIDDMDATVEAGVTRLQLARELELTDLFFSVDPGADATLGGMAATRASGTNTVRYGSMRDNVLALQVVLADGRVITTSSRARKSASGYDLTRLFVGSEGTLGVITQVTVRLHRKPEAICAAVCPFPDVPSAVNTVIKTIQAGVPVARIEFLDDRQLDAVNRHSGLTLDVAPTLFFEFNGSAASVIEQAERVKLIARDFGGAQFRWATSDADRGKLWQARHNAYYAALDLRPGCKGLATDVCVPISRLAECIVQTKEDLQDCSLPVTMLGHAGDGNFHMLFLIDPASPAELAEARRFNHRMVERALAMEGTCTGEHGIGLGKREFLSLEHGPAADVMLSIKKALDPNNIMNPGKVVTWP